MLLSVFCGGGRGDGGLRVFCGGGRGDGGLRVFCGDDESGVGEGRSWHVRYIYYIEGEEEDIGGVCKISGL